MSRAVVAVRLFFALTTAAAKLKQASLRRSLPRSLLGDGDEDDGRRRGRRKTDGSVRSHLLRSPRMFTSVLQRERETGRGQAASPSPVHPFRPSFLAMARYSVRMFGPYLPVSKHTCIWYWSCCAKVKPRPVNSAFYPLVLRPSNSRVARKQARSDR